MYSYYNSCLFLKKTAVIETAVASNCMMLMKENKMDVHMLVFSCLCSGIPVLVLEILVTLIGVCFRDVLQLAFYQFAPSMI